MEKINESKIETIKQTLLNLPSIEERLRTWHGIIKSLDLIERECLEKTINELENNDLSSCEFTFIELEHQINQYSEKLFELICRLNFPIKTLSEKIEELSNIDFKRKMAQFRKDEELRCKEKAEKLAEKYKSDFNSQSNQWDYVRSAQSMVTGFLFQPGIYPTNSQEERKAFHKAFEGFNPQIYVTVFCKKLNELFKS